MTHLYKKISFTLTVILFTVTNLTFGQSNPTTPAQDFNVFIEHNLTLSNNESEGPVACGGDMNIAGDYQVATHDPGTFTVGGNEIGLLIGGKVNYNYGNSVQVNSNGYIKIGDNTGSVVWYHDPNNATPPIRITPGPNYNSSPRIMLQANSNQLNVSANNNPVFESGLIDFSSAFQEMRATALSISQCTDNANLTNPNGQPIPHTNLPHQVKINLQDGINYLNVTGADMNNVQVFTYNQQPSASKILIINVDAPDTFNWKVWNQGGFGGLQQCRYIFYNFYNTTQLNVKGYSSVEGTLFAPFADIDKTVNNSNIQGQVIGKSLIHNGGEMHYAIFAPSLPNCGPPTNVPPTSDFAVNNDVQCFNGNEFIFTNTSNTGTTVQPGDPMSYSWDFGDGTASQAMDPTKTYSSAGTYHVKLTTTNTYGTDSKTSQVKVFPPTGAMVSIATTSSSSGSVTKQFTLINSSDFTSFSWTFPGMGSGLYPNQSPVSRVFTQAGYYEIKIMTVDANGCDNTTIIPVVIESDEVNTGHDGGLESHSLGDAVSKRYVNRKKKSISTAFVKSTAKRFDKQILTANSTERSESGQTLVDMFPSQLVPGDVARITSPTDILDYTVAEEVLSVDFSVDGNTKGVVLGVLTKDKIYNHTKASCDRLKGAEIMNVGALQIEGYNFLMQAMKQRDGVTEYAISFAVGKNDNHPSYSLQSNWYVNVYTPSNDVYNFQVWATNPTSTEKLVKDILNNLKAYAPLYQNEVQEIPKTYAAKVSREGTDLVLKLRSLKKAQSIEISMDENYSETNGFTERYNPVNSDLEQTLRINIDDAYEFDGLIRVNGEVQDAFYQADGNWGLDFDSKYTTLEKYRVSNNLDRVYKDDELPVNRNVEIKAHSEYDYLTLYKSLLPAELPADYTNYSFVSFKAKGSGLLDIGLVKSSIDEWKKQFKATINVGENEQTYYIPFDFFKSVGTNKKITADDLTMLTFTFLPVEAQTNDLDLTISDVKFTKTAPDGYRDLLNTMENEFKVYPNPSRGNVNCLLYSDDATKATINLHDVTGRLVYSKQVNLTKGRNEFNLNINADSGLFFFNVSNGKTNYGSSKIIFR